MKTRRSCAALLLVAFSMAGCQGSSASHLTPTPNAAGKTPRKPNTVVSNQCVPVSGQSTGTITEYSIPTASTQPYGLVVDASQNVWFGEFGAAALGKLSSAHSFSQYSTPTHSSEPISVTIASDGNPWFTEFATGKVAKFNTSTSTMTEYGFSGSSGSYPEWIDNSTVAATAGMWLPLNGNTQLAKVSTSGTISYSATTDRPYGLSVDTVGNIWYTMYNPNKVAVETVGHTSTVWTVPTAGSQPFMITEGPAGSGMWFTEYHGNKIGNISTSGHLTEYTIPTSASSPEGIVSACGNLWFAENATNKIGEISPTGTFTEYSIPTASSAPTGVAVDANGNVWFTERSGNKIAEIATVGAAATPPDGGFYALNSSGGSIVHYTTGSLTPPPAGILTSFPGAGVSTDAGMAFDPSGNVWVSGGGYVAEYAPGASGSTPPLTSFTTSATDNRAIAVDAEGEILTADPTTNAIYVYAATSTGAATPIRTISGTATELNQPYRMVMDGSDNVWVMNVNTGVETFPASASGNVSPSLNLDATWMSNNGLSVLDSIAIDYSGGLIVLANDGENVLRFAPGVGESSLYSSEFNTGSLTDIAVDDEGYIYATALAPGINIYAPGATGSPAPYVTIASSNDGLQPDPISIAVWSNASWWYGGDARHAHKARRHARP
jgi:streptogramin lyase